MEKVMCLYSLYSQLSLIQCLKNSTDHRKPRRKGLLVFIHLNSQSIDICSLLALYDLILLLKLTKNKEFCLPTHLSSKRTSSRTTQIRIVENFRCTRKTRVFAIVPWGMQVIFLFYFCKIIEETLSSSEYIIVVSKNIRRYLEAAFKQWSWYIDAYPVLLNWIWMI